MNNYFKKGNYYKYISKSSDEFTNGCTYRCKYADSDFVEFFTDANTVAEMPCISAEACFTLMVDNNKDKEDRVEHPKHYTWLKELCGIEPVDICRHLNFNIGCAIKYLLRKDKEDIISLQEKRIEDLKKAKWYIEDEIKRVQKETNIINKNE